MDTEALNSLQGDVAPYPPDDTNPATAALRKFAQDNDYSFYLRKPELVQYSWRDYKYLPAHLGSVGLMSTKDAYYVMAGEYMSYPITMYLMWDNLANGRIYTNPNEQQKKDYTQQQTTGIVSISLPKVFPQIVLDSNKNDRAFSSIRSEYKQAQRVELEGNFSDHFDLYFPEGLQIDALSLLAPNMMQILKKSSGVFDVEFFGNKMVLMTRRPLYSQENIDLLDSALTEQLTYMNRLLQSWNYTPRAQPFDLLEKPSIGGTTMKIGRFRISARVQLVAVLLLFSVFIAILAIFQ